MPSWFVCGFFFFFFSLRCFSILCYASGFYMLLFFRQMFLTRARARVWVCVVHWHCTAQLSMFNMEKRFRNKIICSSSASFEVSCTTGLEKGGVHLRISRTQGGRLTTRSPQRWDINSGVVSTRTGQWAPPLLARLTGVWQASLAVPPRWPNGKASASRAEGPGFESRLRRDFFGVESYQWLKNWHSTGYPARRLAL